MKRVVLTFAILVGLFNLSHAYTPNEWVMRDGIILPKKWRIDLTTSGANVWCETDAEKNGCDISLTANGVTHSVVQLSQAVMEIAISTTISFSSFDDFNQTMTSKSYIANKVIELQKTKSALEALQISYPSFVVPLQSKINKIKNQLDWLVTLFGTL